MRTLAIECATEACSAALFEDGVLLAGAFEVIGRGHAERLVPMIAELPGNGRADRILVSLGPGSFTGVRVGLAAARALALAWRAECLGYPTLALVAAQALTQRAGPATGPVGVCMSGGHGEWFVQDFGADGLPQHGLQSLVPDQARQTRRHAFAAGSKARELLETAGPDQEMLDILPDARQIMAMRAELHTADLSPIYGRAPDARPSATPA